MGLLDSLSLKKLVAITIAFRLLQFIIVAFCPMQFDSSTSILIDTYMQNRTSRYPPVINNILNKLMSWDSVYFLKLSLSGIDYEHEWVFGPLWWRLLAAIKSLGNGIVDLDIYDILLLSIVINNIVLLITAVVVYKLAFLIAQNEFVSNFVIDKQFAYVSALLITFQPSGIFSIVGYSESISQLLCFTAVYFRQSAIGKLRIRNKHLYEITGILFALAFGFRSNCLLYGLLYIYDMIKFPYFRSKLTALFTGFVLFLALLYSIYVPYNIYCPERGEWCNSFSKSLVSFAQAHYWNTGFLNYFTPNNIPNFLFAFPQLTIIALSLFVFSNWEVLRGELIVGIVYLFVQFTVMHVQIVNRVSTFLPLHILYEAYLLTQKKTLGKIILVWWIIWVLLQTALFAAFLPPA